VLSVLCSYEIVKRVVTVKQVRSSSGGMRSGLGMGMRSRCASIGGAVLAHRSRRSEIADRRSEKPSAGRVAGREAF
jgi:hypothetical protein